MIFEIYDIYVAEPRDIALKNWLLLGKFAVKPP